jgi:hypothetical protein
MSLTLALPSTSLASTRPISTVVVSPLPLASILDHHLRRAQSDTGLAQDRVFGTLLGVRREVDNEVEVRNAFGVNYATKGAEQVQIDVEHHKALLDLHLKVNPKEVVVGWWVPTDLVPLILLLIRRPPGMPPLPSSTRSLPSSTTSTPLSPLLRPPFTSPSTRSPSPLRPTPRRPSARHPAPTTSPSFPSSASCEYTSTSAAVSTFSLPTSPLSLPFPLPLPPTCPSTLPSRLSTTSSQK